MSARKTLKQQTAIFAWDKVSEANQDTRIKFSEYTQVLQGTGAMILSCGLGQTVAFYYSQSGSHYKLILEQWAKFLELNSIEDLIKRLMVSSSTYRLDTNRIMSLLEWQKRYTKGMGG